MAASEPLPLARRIEAAEAYVELVWAKHQAVPAGRGFDSQKDSDWERSKYMDSINFMLERLLQFYDERALDGVA